VTIDSFKIAQELLERGLNPYEIAKNMYQRRSLANLRILGRAIDSLKLYEDAKVAVMTLSQRDMSATGAKDSDLDGLVDYALSLVTVEIAFLVVELKDSFKVSIRSKGADIVPLSIVFGGGGHKVAAGFELKKNGKTLTDIIEDILKAIEKEGIVSGKKKK